MGQMRIKADRMTAVGRLAAFMASLLAIGGVGVLHLASPAAAASSDIVMTSSVNPSVYGQIVNLTATPAAGLTFRPGSRVTFYDGGMTLSVVFFEAGCGDSVSIAPVFHPLSAG